MVPNFFLFFLDISKIKIYNKKTSFILQRVEITFFLVKFF